MNQSKLSVRVNRKNPNHHLWNNNGTWWFHCTVITLTSHQNGTVFHLKLRM